jgi:flagellar assembly factor FliW
LWKATISFIMSVRPFALIFEYFSKICQENSSFIKIRQEQQVLYLKTTRIFDHISLISS